MTARKTRPVKPWKEYRVVATPGNVALKSFPNRVSARRYRDAFFNGWDVIQVLVTPAPRRKK